MCDLSAPYFKDEELARQRLESIRWPDGPVCPHCGCYERVMNLKGQATRKGVYKCGDCRKQFTVTVGTVIERSHIPLTKWLMAAHLMCSSKKGISAHQLHRMLGITYKSAWFMAHRLREAMKPADNDKIGGDGETVEIDETYWTPVKRKLGGDKNYNRAKIISLVEREGGVKSYHVARVTTKTVDKIIKNKLAARTVLMSDDYLIYQHIDKERITSHHTVMHSHGEYARDFVHTNTIEGYFGILKRGLRGIYQHFSQRHLQRYLDEFDFRYTHRQKLGYEDSDRAVMMLKGISGKRLMYQSAN